VQLPTCDGGCKTAKYKGPAIDRRRIRGAEMHKTVGVGGVLRGKNPVPTTGIDQIRWRVRPGVPAPLLTLRKPPAGIISSFFFGGLLLSHAVSGTAASIDFVAVTEGNAAYGAGPPSVSGGNNVAVGAGTKATGQSTTAVGSGAQATNQNATALGVLAAASGDASIALGWKSIATGSSGTAIGSNARATAQNTIAMSSNATASGINAVALGFNSSATLQIRWRWASMRWLPESMRLHWV